MTARAQSIIATAHDLVFWIVTAQGQKRDIIHEHNKVNATKGDNCSLRRSKSLAVIREETYNELAPTGTKNRRSQLIPRAKLIDRNFFKDR
jgi:hypothetical protein